MKNLEKLNMYKKQLSHFHGAIQSHNFIVKCGAYTVGLNEDNETVLEIVSFPSQFTSEQVKQIKSECKASRPFEVILAVDWYGDKIKALETIVEYGL